MNGNHLDYTPTIGTMECYGAFEAIQGLSVIKYERQREPILGFCPPSESSLSQFVKIFVRYADDHPERLHEGFALVALSALSVAFPCGKR